MIAPNLFQIKHSSFLCSLILLLNFAFCKSPDLNSPCDPKTDVFLITWAIKTSIGDTSSFCGLRNLPLQSLSTTGEVNSSNEANSGSNSGSNSGATASTSTNRVATPTFSISAGTYSSPQNISIAVSESGATIYYTLDGTAPSSTSSVFTNAFPIWQIAGKNIRAFARIPSKEDSAELSGIFSYSLLRTRQTNTYQSGDDGETLRGISPSYGSIQQHPTFTNDYTITDNITGLTWKSCSQGLSGALCANGSFSAFSHSLATTSCSDLNSANAGSGYAGRTNWRLPTMKELTTLTNFQLTSNTIDATSFPINGNFAYWTTSTYPANATFRWYVDYSYGGSYANDVVANYHARCVSAPGIAESTSFSDLGNGIIKDNVTGLFWQKCSRGQTNDSSCSGAVTLTDWTNALPYCNGLSLGGRTWRLPNINELYSIFDYTVGTGARISSTFFPSTPSDANGFFWSSTSYIPNVPTANAWAVNFGDTLNMLGDSRPKSNTYSIRCVAN